MITATGAVRSWTSAWPGREGRGTKMSMTNNVVGTPPYMAPEQEQGTVRQESDV